MILGNGCTAPRDLQSLTVQPTDEGRCANHEPANTLALSLSFFDGAVSRGDITVRHNKEKEQWVHMRGVVE